MKIIDKYILTSFAKTFFSVFAILYFIFILQGVWVFIGELAGKDLDLLTVAKFLFYYSPRMISMVLPLSVVLASIMTFGDFSENYEFAAMKSAGISLQRAMYSLILFILGLSLVSFWFVNNVAPKAEFKFVNMRFEIMQSKPAMAVAPGFFNDLGNINIKVDKKTGDKGQYLDNILMHIRSEESFSKNKTIIKSDSGRLQSPENSKILQLQLIKGNYYEDVETKNYKQRERLPFVKADFDKYTINIDLSEFDNKNNSHEIANVATMMTVGQLLYVKDSLSTQFLKEERSQNDNVASRIENILEHNKDYKNPIILKDSGTFLRNYSKQKQLRMLRTAQSSVMSMKNSLQSNLHHTNERLKNINRHEHVFHEKFVIAFSCLLMFFIGAPLGAIIRKGGLGLPMVFAVIIFIIFHFINTFGKKMAQENAISGWLGAWLATFILLPLAIFFTSRATRDRGISSIDNILYPITQYIKGIIIKIKQKK